MTIKEDYKIFGKPSKCQIILLTLSIIILLISIGCWVAFPPIYKSEVKENLILAENEDGSFPKSTFFWANAPSNTYMYFYIFNLTNGDEVEFLGIQPNIIEVGPYTIKEEEHKKNVQFNDNKTTVYYKNYKEFIYQEDKSCQYCSKNGIIHFPNLILIGALAELADPEKKLTPLMQSVLGVGIHLIGEYTFIDVGFEDLMFKGYHDNLLTFGTSGLFKFINGHFGKDGKPLFPFDIPDMKKMGIFYGYNNTNDADYVIKTGKDNMDDYGKIVTWAGSKYLPKSFWSTKEARMINGSDVGSLQHMEIKKSDVLQQFNSYLCRSFDMIYQEDGEISGIPAYKFYVPYDNYDTTLEKNKGFRYANKEKINYFPQWPKCDNNSSSMANSTDCSNKIIDCTIGPNLCDPCCNGSFVDGTYLLPPGIYPISCYPGRTTIPPFLLFFSAPHFYYSPPEVADAIYGLRPNKKEHEPIFYYHEPYSGQVLNVNYKFQVNCPIFGFSNTIINKQMPNNIIPIFWASTEGHIYDSLISQLYLGFVFVPRFIFILKIVTLVDTNGINFENLNEPIIIIPGLNIFDLQHKANELKNQTLENVARIVDKWNHGYSFIVPKNNGIIFGKDPIGRYSLLISMKNKQKLTLTFMIHENDDESYIELPSGSLFDVTISKDQTSFHIKCLSLNNFEYMNMNWTQEIFNSQYIECENNKKFLVSSTCIYNDKLENEYAESIGKKLHEIYDIYKVYNEKSLCVMFSGGIDSVSVAYSLLQNLPNESILYLINVGSLNDKGFVSTPDRERSLRAFNEFKRIFPDKNIIYVCCDLSKDAIEKAKVNIIHKACRPKLTKMDESIALVQYFAFLGKGYNVENNRAVVIDSNIFINGSGADEIFGGYMKHRQCYNLTKCYKEICFCLQKELYYLGDRNHGRDSRLIEASKQFLHCFKRNTLSPFLTNEFIYFATSIPINMKSDFEKPRGEGEKSLLRLYLKKEGLSKEIYCQPKQAMQFGSKIGYHEQTGTKGTDLILCNYMDYDKSAKDYIIQAIQEKWVVVDN
uniref:Scavenger receptor class B member 1 n=1 Tax=Parastrongyloides trichosuri TaxID=131310 RepID=A0A0N4ZN79_PARTI